jgi:hypothetical protein
MSEGNNFFETLGNPNYAQQQEQVVRSLHVADASKVLSPKTYSFYEANIDHKGLLQQDVRDGSESRLALYNQDDGITAIVETKPEPLEKGRRQITHYFYVDRTTGKAWDASQLWSTVPECNSKIEHKGGLTKIIEGSISGGFTPTGEGGFLFLRLAHTDQNIVNDFLSKLTGRQIDFFNAMAPIHEAGHRFQFYNNVSYFDLPYWDFVRLVFVRLVLTNHTLSAVAGKIPMIKKMFEADKINQRMMERNAAAFALNIVRYLRNQGLHLYRNLSGIEVVNVVEKSLSTYDETFKHIKGTPFTRTPREKK